MRRAWRGFLAAVERHRVLRYALAGLFNTSISFGSYCALLYAGLAVPWASLGGLLAGLGVGFLTQGTLVFRQASWPALARFLAAWAAMYGLHVGVVTGLQGLGLNPYAGGTIAVAAIVALSYFVLRDWVFRQSDDRGARTGGRTPAARGCSGPG